MRFTFDLNVNLDESAGPVGLTCAAIFADRGTPEIARRMIGTLAREASKIRFCRMCGCSEFDACEGGCGWAGANLCTKCAGVDPGSCAGATAVFQEATAAVTELVTRLEELGVSGVFAIGRRVAKGEEPTDCFAFVTGDRSDPWLIRSLGGDALSAAAEALASSRQEVAEVPS